MTDQFPRAALGFWPTPIEALGRLSKWLGIQVFIKRDDQAGLALGGNKTRKLEFLIGAALAQGCDTVITGGAAQSNHCRQTAAAAAKCGLQCHLVLGGEEPDQAGGNLLLNILLGAYIHYCGPLRKGERIPEIAETLRHQGESLSGSLAVPMAWAPWVFARGAIELASQLDALEIAPSAIVFASSSGGTHAGLLLGAMHAGLRTRMLGIEIDKGEAGVGPFSERVVEIANEAAVLVGAKSRFTQRDVDLAGQFTGGGYGVVGERERNAITLMAAMEGILLDPVYTGRAFGGLIELAQTHELGPGPVVFWHTGGTPALFSYGCDLI